nr:MAG TPA: hypothetical protein [Caudoviricetes sp.]
MEIKAQLEKPYTEEQRLQFIVDYNHKLGYALEETETHLNAMEYTEEELRQQERDRIDALCLTRSDVERAIYADKGMDFDDLIEYVKANVPTMNIKALKIELRANNFYRRHPYINQLGAVLEYTSDDLDYLFQNKALPEKVAEPAGVETSVVEESSESV